MGRATQGVRLINLAKKNDVIASVCKVMSSELESIAEEESRKDFASASEEIKKSNTALPSEDADVVDADVDDTDVMDDDSSDNNTEE